MHLYFITFLTFICPFNAKYLCSEGAIENYFDDLNYVGDSEYFGEIDLNTTIKNLAKSIEFLTAQGNYF
jgi:hypothetical protein